MHKTFKNSLVSSLSAWDREISHFLFVLTQIKGPVHVYQRKPVNLKIFHF